VQALLEPEETNDGWPSHIVDNITDSNQLLHQAIQGHAPAISSIRCTRCVLLPLSVDQDTAWQDKSSTNAPSSAPATSQPSKISAPANAPQATAPQAPAPSTPTSAAVQPTSGSACSATDTSAQAVEDCVNAMRRNPRAWTDHFPASCGWQSWINEVSNPRRPKLNSDDRLASSSRRMAEDMAG
jgi:hypothetical protein